MYQYHYNICATSSVPIAAVLLLKGLSPGALLIFLMAGPATNAATITVIAKNLGKKTLIAYLSSLILGSLLFGLLIDNLLPAHWFSPLSIISGQHEHQLLPNWIIYSSTLALVLMLLYSFYTSIIEKITNMNKKNKSNLNPMLTEELVLKVEGMSCIRCKAKVENGIINMTNISSVIADNENDLLKVYGSNLSVDEIAKKVDELGYEYKGVIK